MVYEIRNAVVQNPGKDFEFGFQTIVCKLCV